MSTATLFAPPEASAQRPQPVIPPPAVPVGEAALMETRYGQWFAKGIDGGSFEAWVANQFVVQTVRLDACREDEDAIRRHAMLRAKLNWDGDRELEAALLGDKLGKNPAHYLRRLRESFHGCVYLAERWEMLRRALETTGAWTESQESSALDLLGVPLDMRDVLSPLEPKRGADRLEHRKEVCRADIVALMTRAQALKPLDARARADAEQGLGLDSKPLRAQQRYERQCFQRLQWAIAELDRVRAQRAPEPAAARPRPSEPPKAAPAPQPIPPIPSPIPSASRETPSFAPIPTKPPIHENRRARRARMKMARSGG